MAKVMFVEVNIRRTALQYFWSVGPVTGFVATSAGASCEVSDLHFILYPDQLGVQVICPQTRPKNVLGHFRPSWCSMSVPSSACKLFTMRATVLPSKTA